MSWKDPTHMCRAGFESMQLWGFPLLPRHPCLRQLSAWVHGGFHHCHLNRELWLSLSSACFEGHFLSKIQHTVSERRLYSMVGVLSTNRAPKMQHHEHTLPRGAWGRGVMRSPPMSELPSKSHIEREVQVG